GYERGLGREAALEEAALPLERETEDREQLEARVSHELEDPLHVEEGLVDVQVGIDDEDVARPIVVDTEVPPVVEGVEAERLDEIDPVVERRGTAVEQVRDDLLPSHPLAGAERAVDEEEHEAVLGHVAHEVAESAGGVREVVEDAHRKSDVEL